LNTHPTEGDTPMGGYGEYPRRRVNNNDGQYETTTPQMTNRQSEYFHPSQSRIRFSEDTRLPPPTTTNHSNRVLVLEGSPPRRSSSAAGVDSLDFSMITTPGAKHTPRNDETEGGGGGGARWRNTVSNGTPLGNLFSSAASAVISTPGTPGFQTPFTTARGMLSSRQTQTPYTTPGLEYDTNTNNNDDDGSAHAFAKTAPLSGYLRKLGKNIHTYKRRFFVLKPATHLYYFLSPNDVEPRGCIDLDMNCGCEVREVGTLPDGTFRFELIFNEEDTNSDTASVRSTSSHTSNSSSSTRKQRGLHRQNIVLEARTVEIGREWIAKLKSERLSTARLEVESLRTDLVELKNIGARWERSAIEEAMRADEAARQRDAAITESRVWEEKYTNLNEGIRLLTNSICSPDSGDATSEFLTDAVGEIDISGSNFSAISTAFLQIHNEHKLLSKRDDDAKLHILELERLAKDAESRATTAEEELSAMQMDLRRIKREKKILVTEVRSLHAAANLEKQETATHTQFDQKQNGTDSISISRGTCEGDDATSDTASMIRLKRKANVEENRLIIELEENVMSGLRLTDQFLTLNGIDPSEIWDDLDNSVQAGSSIQASKSSREDRSLTRQSTNHHHHQASAARVGNETTQHRDYLKDRLGSLLDENDDETIVPSVTDELNVRTPHVSNKHTNQHNFDINQGRGNHVVESTHGPIFHYEGASPNGEPVNQNLIDRFKRESSEKEIATNNFNPPSLSVASSISESSRSRITDNGFATSKLEHRLKAYSTPDEDGNVYHITFYSSRIGLQFQKVPNEVHQSTGLLTEAVTGDGNVGTMQTAAEHKRIAIFSQHSQSNRNQQNSISIECQPATPADAILVCGFIGFDDSTGNSRPQLGGKCRNDFFSSSLLQFLLTLTSIQLVLSHSMEYPSRLDTGRLRAFENPYRHVEGL